VAKSQRKGRRLYSVGLRRLFVEKSPLRPAVWQQTCPVCQTEGDTVYLGPIVSRMPVTSGYVRVSRNETKEVKEGT
jgi:hypothetical protein